MTSTNQKRTSEGASKTPGLDLDQQNVKEAENGTEIPISDTSSNDDSLPVRTRSSKSLARSVSTISSFGPTTNAHLLPGQIFVDKGRPKWSREWDSLIANIGSAVGISNIARFPLDAYRNGGSAFLVPYTVFLILIAFPLMYQQRILGQFVQQGCISVYKIVPIFKGIGYAIQLISILFICFYTITLAWTIVYICESCNSTLGYTTCSNGWNTPSCITPNFAGYATSREEGEPPPPSAGREYFRGRVLRLWPSGFSDGDALDEISSSISSRKHLNNSNNTPIFGFHSKLGSPVWDLTGCMLFLFFCYFLVLVFGIKWTRNIAWVSVIPSYVILPILLMRGLTLNGASNGLKDLITPRWYMLKKPATWVRAAMLAIGSTSAGDSVQMNLASLNYFKHDTYRDALLTIFADTLTNIMTSVIMFCLIGNAAYTQTVEVKDVVANIADGSDLIFELYTDVMWSVPGARFFILVFYILVFLIGLNSVIPTIQAIMMGYMDEFKKWFPPETNSTQILNFTLTSWAFLGSLACCTRGGIWVFKFMGIYAASISLMICVVLQMIVVSWLWGLQDLCNAAEAMTGRMPGAYLRICWKYVAPIIMTCLVYFEWVDLHSVEIVYNGVTAPAYLHKSGIFIMFLPLLFIPLFAIYQLIHYPADNFKLRLRLLLHPENEHREIRKGHVPTPRYNISHLFYLGLFAGCVKKTPITPKPKIHPARRSGSKSGGDEDFLDQEKDEGNVDPNQNIQDTQESEDPAKPGAITEQIDSPSEGLKSIKNRDRPSGLAGQSEPSDPKPDEDADGKKSPAETPSNTSTGTKRKHRKKRKHDPKSDEDADGKNAPAETPSNTSTEGATGTKSRHRKKRKSERR